jgi:hypothetical protein
MSSNLIVDRRHCDEFMKTYAQALLTWQVVEQNIFFIFSHVVRSNAQYPVVSALYHTVINFNARLEMVDAAMQIAYQGNPKLDEWRSLVMELTGCVKFRNKLAHSTLIVHKNREIKTLRLAPSAFDVRDGQDVNYTLKQMAGWKKRFRELGLKTATYAESINAVVPDHRNIYSLG